MPGDSISSSDLGEARFRQAWRGYDPRQVSDFLAEAARALRAVEEERDRLLARLGELGDKDLSAEFDRVSRDVKRILDEAKAAADGLRDRAASEAAQWRTEANAEAEEARRAAAAESEALRRDAWATGEHLLGQVQEEAEGMRQGAERDALSIIGEAERDAHRTITSARREADDLLRVSKMEADRLQVEAKGRHDEIIDEARREADQAQERAKALEVRRTELLAELENVRSTIQRLEAQIDQRQAAVPVIEEPSGVRVVPAEGGGELEPSAEVSASGGWGTEENVRVVPLSGRQPRPAPVPETPVDAAAMADEVRRLRGQQAKVVEQPPPPQDEEEIDQVQSEGVDRLFASLRDLGAVWATAPRTSTDDGSLDGAPHEPTPTGISLRGDPGEVRTRLLLPIVNEALRSVKRHLTDAQNEALEGLRTSDDWQPAQESLAGLLSDDVTAMTTSSFGAGSDAARELVGVEAVDLPRTGLEDPTADFATALCSDVRTVLEKAKRADQGALQVSSSVARVYRSWRTDKAERRLLAAAEAAYETGLRAALARAGVAPEAVVIGS
ncbi:MAG TPA: DivIVA domain-containing protein [Acidimicrobiia bacterium]